MIRGGFDSQLTADPSTLDRGFLEALEAAPQEDTRTPLIVWCDRTLS